ncbi:MAG: DEAD/DEAH box helicase family protein [Candidatus Schekmanbacteria bacterium]|nr:DEAD/DEAH box helicase family protein [Candidatus Schekmanbacteria bacterium]
MTTYDSTTKNLQLGDVVAGLEPGELVAVQRVEPFGSKVLVEGIGATTRRQIRWPLSLEELGALSKVRGATHSFDGDPKTSLLGAEAERIRIAHQFDPLFAVNSSIVDPLPHQVEAVYRYLLPLPRIRFLLADDTGAGKTIMTGLLIKELLFRGVIQKILVVTPGGLTKQWAEEELLGKFGLYAPIVNRASFDADPSQFSRVDEGIFVTSVDFMARNEACLSAAAHVPWDLIVVDEAHKLSAYEYGSKIAESARYKALKELSRRVDHLLFLTATPHRGRKDTFRRLLLLLDEDLFRKDEHVADRVREQTASYPDPGAGDKSITRARNRFFLRRLKEEMVDWEGGALFKPRHTKTVGYDLTSEEKQLYDAVTQYVRSKRREAKARKNRHVELTLPVMQRRLASSIFAITRTLENRLRALNEVLAILRDPNRSAAEKKRLFGGATDADAPRDIGEYEELSEEERDEIDRRIFRQVLTSDPEKVEQERDEIDRLCRTASALKHHNEAKLVELLRVLDSSDVIRAEDEKLLSFTEHKDTLRSLEERLTKRGYSVATIHGSLDVEARKQAQRELRTAAKVMVATDAAGEGINLQFCRYLINWDIPWNPNRLEQRMGRIHRNGQQDDVWVYDLVAQNTREGAVLQRVLTKMDVMRDQLGDDRVYDVIDEWLEGVPLVALMEMAIDAEAPDEGGAETDEALKQATQERAEDLLGLQKSTSLASRLDLRAARELRDASDERRLQPLFVQRFFARAWAAAGGTMQRDEHFPVWQLSATPTALLDLARERKAAVPDRLDTPVLFDKQLVSVASKVRVPERTKLLGPGHALFDTLIEWAIREARAAGPRRAAPAVLRGDHSGAPDVGAVQRDASPACGRVPVGGTRPGAQQPCPHRHVPLPERPWPVAACRDIRRRDPRASGSSQWRIPVSTDYCPRLIEASNDMPGSIADRDYRRALLTYLAFWIDGVAVFGNSMCRWNAAREAIQKAVGEAVHRFWSYGFRGADLIVSSYGPAVGVFGKYERVERADGTPVAVPELLDFARQAARDAIAGEFRGDNLSTLYYVWANLYGAAEQSWDDARLVVQIGGEAESAMDVARRDGVFVIDGPKCRRALLADRADRRGLGVDPNPPLIDALHRAMLLWKNEQRGELVGYLAERGLLDETRFWMLAQALFEVLPRDREDSKLVSALLGERDTLRSGAKRSATPKAQRSFFETGHGR